MSDSGYQRLVRADEVPAGTLRQVRLGGRALVVANVDGTFYAYENVCPHARAPLHEGQLKGCQLTCPWHGSRFDLCEGALERGPARATPRRYAIRVADGWVSVADNPGG